MGEITYLYLDAQYEKVREAGQVRDEAVLGVSVFFSEHETHSPR